MMLESQFIDFICQTSLGVCVNSIKSGINKDKLREKIQEFAKTEFESKFNCLDLSSEIDFDGLSTYLKDSLMHEIENYITAPNVNIKKTLVTKACNEAKADNRDKEAVVITFIESVVVIMKQDFISNVDKSLKIFANDLKDDLFNDIKNEIFENTNKIMGGISTLNDNDNSIMGNQAIEISKLNKIVDLIESATIQQPIEKDPATDASISNPFDLVVVS